MDLYNSLKQEQTACLGFIIDADAVSSDCLHRFPSAFCLHTLFGLEWSFFNKQLLQVLSSLQEAILDVRAAPWCPVSLTTSHKP